MKTIKIILISSLMSLSLHAAFGQQQPETNTAATTQATKGLAPDQAGAASKELAQEEGDKIGDELLAKARENAQANDGDKALEQLKSLVNSAQTLQALQQVSSQLKDSSQFCTKFVEEGVKCCTTPDQCGGTSSLQRAANTAGQAGDIGQAALAGAGGGSAGGGGEGGGGGGGGAAAAAQCLSALPGLTSNLAASDGTGKACKGIRDGGAAGGGCVDMCNQFKQLADEVGRKSTDLIGATGRDNVQLQKDGITANSIKQEASQVSKEMGSGESTCQSSLSGGEAAAGQQSAANGSGIDGLMQCLQSLLNGEETPEEEEEQKTAVNCANPASAAENPTVCKGTGQARDSGLALGKSQALDLNGDAESDLEDDDVLPDDRFPAGAGNAGVVPNGNNTNGVGALGAGAGAGGAASEKAGRGLRGDAKGKKLVTGYRKTKGGGGYGSGRGGKLSFNPFKFKKEKPKFNDKKALAALAALQKAKIDPNVAGSIFERSTNRFASSTVKYKLFDAPKNKTLWMRKK